MKSRYIVPITVAVALVAAIAFLVITLGPGMRKSSYAPSWMRETLKAPRETGELVILTLRGPTTTQDLPTAGKGKDDTQTGFEHDLATLFAKELGVEPRFVVMPSYKKLIEALRENRGHIAAAGITPTVDLRNEFAFSPSYRLIQYQLVYRADEPKPKSMRDTAKKSVAVIAETPAHDLLRELTGDYPEMILDVQPHEMTQDDLLQRLDDKASDYALVDAIGFAVGKRLHPDLASAFNVGRENKVSWAFAPIADYDLQRSVVLFFDKIRQNGTLTRLMDRYYGHINRIQPVDAESLLEKVQTLLPKLRSHFHEAQQLTGIDWRVLAAIGYQESHWEATATSPTGVRGLMMLTEDTADRMGVKNRLDPRESIIGGAKYLQLLRDTIPDRIVEPDRTWLALAAYNQGYGHLEDARILTQRMKLNADSWLDVRKAYAKLKDPEVHAGLKFGFARGDEAVQFVENIRNYTDIINRLERPLELDIHHDLLLTDSSASPLRKKDQASSNVSSGK
ncbi:MAG: membrane-bound lytic murein transglycosylase MltF [Betaproteobacteria bacterium]